MNSNNDQVTRGRDQTMMRAHGPKKKKTPMCNTRQDRHVTAGTQNVNASHAEQALCAAG